MFKPFSEHNKLFVEKCNNPLIFNYDEFNFIKIVQQALIYSNNGLHKKLLKNYFNLPTFFIKFIYRIKNIIWNIKNYNSIKVQLKPILFIDNGRERYTEEKKPVSMYYTKFYNSLKRDEYTVFLKKNHSKLPVQDYNLPELKKIFSSPPIDKKAEKVLKAIKEVQKKIENSKIFSEKEIEFINYFFHLFFQDFLFYNFIQINNELKVVVFDNHYYNEGMIAAFKINGVKTIEIQHGLITENDLFYVYPIFISEVASKAFFADKIAVYGEYWKRKLLKGYEYKSNNIIVFGDYTYSKSTLFLQESKENIVFIGAQKFMGQYYLEYIEGIIEIIEKKYIDWKIVVKLHPSEQNIKQYDTLKKHKSIVIIGNETDLIEILKKSKIQISYYSTTLFDAIGLDVVNFSIQNHSIYADYCKEMLDDNIAFPILFGEDPIEKYNTYRVKTNLKREYIYDLFKENVFIDQIGN